MERRDTIHAIILAASLFSLSLLLFSQGVNSLSVTFGDQPIAVKVPTLFPVDQVYIMIAITAIGAHSFTLLAYDIFRSGIASPASETNNKEKHIDDNKQMDYEKKHDRPEQYGAKQDPITDETAQVNEDSKTDKIAIAVSILEGDEKEVYRIISEKGEIFQSELVLESGFTKVKISRLLQKLERKSLISRKVYGNTNKITILK